MAAFQAGPGSDGWDPPERERSIFGLRDAPQMGSWSWWPRNGRLLASQGVYRLLGLDPEGDQLDLDQILEQVAPEDRDRLETIATTEPQERETIDLRFNISRQDGETRRVHVIGRAERDEQGIPDHWWGTMVDITDLPEPEKETMQSEAAYRTLLGDLLAVVYRLKGDPLTGELEFLGPYTHQVLGYRPDAFREEPALWRKAVHPDDRDAFEATRRRVVEEGIPAEARYRFKRGVTGDWIWLESHLFPIRDDAGGVTGITGIARDVTDEHEMAAQLDALVHALPDLLVILDDEGRIERFAPTGQAPAYLPPDEMLGKTLDEILPDAKAKTLQGAIDDALGQDRLVTLRYELEIDGAPIRFEGRISPMDDGRVLWLARDISEDAAAREALSRSEKDLRLAEEITGLGQWSWWPATDSLRWSPGNFKLLGYEPGQIQPTYDRYMEHVHPDDRARLEATIEAALEAEERWKAEYRLQAADGQTRILQTIGVVEHEDDGSRRMFGTSLDVTELREEQEKLRTRAADLEAANLELDRFAHAAAHELKEPVRNIASYGEMLEQKVEGQLDDEDHEILQQIIDGAQRMAKRTDDLLTYSEEGMTPRSPERIDLAPILETVVETLGPQLEAAEATVEIGDLGAVEADRRDVVELFEQFLDNAVSFRREEVPLEIEVTASTDGGERIIAITDNGTGIPEGQGDKLFELFEPLHPLAQGGGAGVGLAICRKIIDRYDGRLQAEPAEGGGARILFSLPDAGDPDWAAAHGPDG